VAVKQEIKQKQTNQTETDQSNKNRPIKQKQTNQTSQAHKPLTSMQFQDSQAVLSVTLTPCHSLPIQRSLSFMFKPSPYLCRALRRQVTRSEGVECCAKNVSNFRTAFGRFSCPRGRKTDSGLWHQRLSDTSLHMVQVRSRSCVVQGRYFIWQLVSQLHSMVRQVPCRLLQSTWPLNTVLDMRRFLRSWVS
jgi:hypothetical protein